MRQRSAAEMKGYWKNQGEHLHDKPREGTRVRAAWDRIMASKGEFVDTSDLFKDCKYRNQCRLQLSTTWGLDIAFKGTKWCLVGEWSGKDYIDYLAERYK